MALSIHDNMLVSYEVLCEARTIILRTEYRLENEPTEFVNVTFRGVEGYRFENDAFGNIIFDIETIPLEEFLAEHGEEISESYRVAGSPGIWAESLVTGLAYLREQGTQAFVLDSSYGLSGWVLAREISILPAQQQASADRSQAGAL